MDTFYIILIAMLFMLAIFDLIVGVSNDAVNFLNAAVGSKAFNFKFLMGIASVGVFVGAAFSNGMMDVARHGIFQPQFYTFVEIITILVAVMLTDVILLDIFNTLGMPTSTTVSLVFELLGASCAIASIKIAQTDGLLTFGQLINTEKALSVIIGIFVSVAIAFTVGAIVQYLSRLIFTFGYKKNLKYFIGLFGGVSLTSIFYFILIKGLKNASFVPSGFQGFIHQNEWMILVGMFIAFFAISQFLHVIGVNMLKVIIAFGTFSLALAFAGNDLVNFVGVPLTGLSAFQHLSADAGDPNSYLMGALLSKEAGQWYLLMIAGAVMVLTLLFSRKAKKVTQTSVSLSSQGETDEIFGTNPFARAIVRFFSWLHEVCVGLLPESVNKWLEKRFDSSAVVLEKEDAAFDLIRAAVNLMLASSLIALGTSLKLPLSTTYVTFMVAMGASLADKAWSRESAVFRITGVLSVIGGWFLTAFVAFSSCFVVALVLYYGGMPAKFILFAVVIFLLIRSNVKFKNATKKVDDTAERFQKILTASPDTNVFPLIQEHSRKEWGNIIDYSADCYDQIIKGVLNEDLGKLRISNKQIRIIKKHIERMRRQGTHCSLKMRKEDVLVKNFFLYQATDFLGDSMFDVEQICTPCLQHVDNHFSPLNEWQSEVLTHITADVKSIVKMVAHMVQDTDFEDYESVVARIKKCGDRIVDERKKEMLRNNDATNVGADILYLTILYETRSYLDAIANVSKAARKFLTDRAHKEIVEELGSSDVLFNAIKGNPAV